MTDRINSAKILVQIVQDYKMGKTNLYAAQKLLAAQTKMTSDIVKRFLRNMKPSNITPFSSIKQEKKQ